MNAVINLNPDVPAENLRRLAVAVIQQALMDAGSQDDLRKSLDAMFFFSSPDDFGFWCELWGAPMADGYEYLENLLKYKQARKAFYGRHKNN